MRQSRLCIHSAIGFIAALGAWASVTAWAVPVELDGAPDPSWLAVAPQPKASLTPHEVVSIQLRALRSDDASHRGIEVAFRFASPGNKRNTGPLPRFISMIQDGPYALMLSYKAATLDPVEVNGDRARQAVVLYGARSAFKYIFYLSRQVHESCNGCWMTDAVSVEVLDARQV